MVDHSVVSREEWVVARKELLEKEKQLTRLKDELSRQRRGLPRVKLHERRLDRTPPSPRVRCRDTFSRSLDRSTI